MAFGTAAMLGAMVEPLKRQFQITDAACDTDESKSQALDLLEQTAFDVGAQTIMLSATVGGRKVYAVIVGESGALGNLGGFLGAKA